MEGVYPRGLLYDLMMAVQMNRYKEKARKNATFELLGFDPFIYTKWDLACVECGKVVTHNTAKGTTMNLNDHLELYNPGGRRHKSKAGKDLRHESLILLYSQKNSRVHAALIFYVAKGKVAMNAVTGEGLKGLLESACLG